MIDAIKEKISSSEDKELEIMEILEVKENAIPAIEIEFKEEEKKYQEYKSKKEIEADRVKKELVDIKMQREEVIRSLDPEWVRNYNKVMGSRDRLAVVRIKEGVCMGCYQAVRPQMIIEIKTSEKMHQCPECTRFLYWVEEAEPENESAMPK